MIIGGRHVRIELWWDDYPTRQRHEGVPDGAGTFGAPNVGTQDMGLPGVEQCRSNLSTSATRVMM